MAGKKSELGPTGATVAGNIARLREAQGLNYTDVSRRVSEAGRDISPLAVRRIEEQQRRVDADDLMALALSLGVSPITLLNENLESPEASVSATGVNASTSAEAFYKWLQGESELGRGEDYDRAAWIDYMVRAAPRWRRVQLSEGLHALAAIERGEGAEYEAVKKKYGG